MAGGSALGETRRTEAPPYGEGSCGSSRKKAQQKSEATGTCAGLNVIGNSK